jgi:hypothetical protein
MRNFLILPMLLFSLSTFASSKWEFVGGNTRNDIYFIDGNSYQKSGDSITFWMRTNYGERTELGDLSDKTQITINCRTREWIRRYMMTYDDKNNEGRNTDSFAAKSPWSPIAPDTITWSVMKHVCK